MKQRQRPHHGGRRQRVMRIALPLVSKGVFFLTQKLLTRPQPKLDCVVWLVCKIRIGRLQILILIWDCSWTNILSKKNWFPLLDAGAESRKFSPNAKGPGDRNPSLFLPETSEKCSNCHTEGFFFSIDRWKKERKVGGCRNSALRCHFKGKKSSYCTLTGCSSSLQKSEGETTLFSKNYWTMRAFPDNRFVFFCVWSDQNFDW